jgi:hypothetical protein
VQANQCDLSVHTAAEAHAAKALASGGGKSAEPGVRQRAPVCGVAHTRPLRCVGGWVGVFGGERV